MTNEQAIEKEIQDKGLNAPRLTPQAIDAVIHSEHYTTGREILAAPDQKSSEKTARAMGCITLCVLVLQNGFTVVGKSACASPDNFDAELGRKIAREDARRQIWAFEGYNLRTLLTARGG